MSQTTFINGASLAVARAAINGNADDAELRLAKMENSIIVKSLADLPTPIANEIILTNNNYEWIDNIDLAGNTLVIDSVFVRITGQGSAFSAIFENAVNAIHIKSGGLFLNDISVLDGGAKVADGIQIDSGGILIKNSCILNGFDNGIEATSISILFINNTEFLNSNKIINFIGAAPTGKFSLFSCSFTDYVISAISLEATATIDQFLLTTILFASTHVGSFAILGEVDSANIITRAVAISCSINGAGGTLSGITEKDIKYEFSNCFGIFNSTDYGFMTYSNPGVAATTVTDGSWGPISAIGATWAVAAESARFIEQSDGIMKFTGINKNLGQCEFEISAKTAVGVSNNYEIGISIDGAAPAANSIVPVPISSAGRIAAWSFPSNIDVTDKIWEMKIRGVGTSQNVIFLGAHLRIERT